LIACSDLVSAAAGDSPATDASAWHDARTLTSPEATALARLTRAIVALRAGDDPELVRRLLRRVIDDGQLESVVTACRAFPPLALVSRGDVSLSQALAAIFMRSRDADIARRAGLRVLREHRLKREPLSAREREVYELLIHGRGNREIAEALFISESTAKVHVRHIFEKLGVHTRAEAAGMAAQVDRD
jgi:DNA-binding NarL/FixJ family response regulator